MTPRDPLLGALRSFVAAMAASYDRVEMCYQLCDHTVDILGVAGAGVAVADEAQLLRFVTATSERVVQMEKIQEEKQAGPCVAAFHSQEQVAIKDIREVDEWPAYREVAESIGMRSVVGVPLSTSDRHLGAFNIYHDEIRDWSPDDLTVAGVLADMATAYLLRTSELTESQRVTEQLQGALQSRVVIEQAKGLLAGARDIGLDEAFELLRGHARSNNLSLSDLASAVVNMGLLLPSHPD